MSSCLGIGKDPSKKPIKSQLNELFQKHKISDAEYDSSDVINGNVLCEQLQGYTHIQFSE